MVPGITHFTRPRVDDVPVLPHLYSTALCQAQCLLIPRFWKRESNWPSLLVQMSSYGPIISGHTNSTKTVQFYIRDLTMWSKVTSLNLWNQNNHSQLSETMELIMLSFPFIMLFSYSFIIHSSGKVDIHHPFFLNYS